MRVTPTPTVSTSFVRLDDSEAPLYLLHITGEALTEAHAPAVVAAIEGLCKKRSRFAVVMVLEDPKIPNAKARKILGDGTKRLEDELERWAAGIADVPGSDLLRHAITAIRWIAPPKYPTKAFGSVEEATAWARAQLAEASADRQ